MLIAERREWRGGGPGLCGGASGEVAQEGGGGPAKLGGAWNACCARAARGQESRAAVRGGQRGERRGHAVRARMRGQDVRRGGEELGVQGRAHASVHGSGGARGGAWGKERR